MQSAAGGESSMDSNTNELTAEVYVRSQQLMEPIDTKIETLRQLESTGLIDDLSEYTWPKTITLSEQAPESDVIDAFERMKAWADEHGMSIRPPFSVRTTTSTITDETRTRLRTPVLCLAVYVGEQLANVIPHSRGDDQYRVTDAIAALRTDDLDLFTAAPRSSAPPPDHCPACENRLITIQGLGVCQDCDRIECGNTMFNTRGERSRYAHRT